MRERKARFACVRQYKNLETYFSLEKMAKLQPRFYEARLEFGHF